MYCLAGAQSGFVNAEKDSAGKSIPMPMVEIADINRDGMFDLVFLKQNGDLVGLYN